MTMMLINRLITNRYGDTSRWPLSVADELTAAEFAIIDRVSFLSHF